MPKKILRNKPQSPLRSMKELEYLLGTSREDLINVARNINSYYKPYIQVKGGKKRHIDNPTGRLKSIQKLINSRILSTYPLPSYIMGGRKGYSTKDNAKIHVNQKVVVRIDIRKCYPSTTDIQIFRVYKDYFDCPDKIAALLTRLTTYRKYLPQGASTSSTLINLALLKLYSTIHDITSKNKAIFGSFVDDVCLSGSHAHILVESIVRSIQKEGYAVRNEKIKVMRKGNHQEITGITVNSKVSVPKEKISTFLKTIHNGISDKKVAGIISYVNSINRKQGKLLEQRLRGN